MSRKTKSLSTLVPVFCTGLLYDDSLNKQIFFQTYTTAWFRQLLFIDKHDVSISVKGVKYINTLVPPALSMTPETSFAKRDETKPDRKFDFGSEPVEEG